jgi:glycine betaine/proline transport system ATP-binding protein
MSKITIKDLYLIFGNDKQHALRMLKEGKSKSEILKETGCTVAVKDANLSVREGEIFVTFGEWEIHFVALYQPIDKTYFR